MVNQSINIFSFNTKNISLQIDYLVYYMYFVLILSTRLKEKSTLNFDLRVVSLKYSTNIHTFAFYMKCTVYLYQYSFVFALLTFG